MTGPINRMLRRDEGGPHDDEPFVSDWLRIAANEIAETDPDLLLRLIRSLFEQKVAEARNAALFTHEYEVGGCTGLADVYPFLDIGFEWKGKLAQPLPPRPIHMARTPVLATPWKLQRLVNAFEKHGEGRDRGPWRATDNHEVWLYEPIGLPFVLNGNHSLAMGTFLREGTVTPTEAFDVSEVFRRYRTDGETYRAVDDPTASWPVGDLVWASIFYCGRLLVLARDRQAASG